MRAIREICLDGISTVALALTLEEWNLTAVRRGIQTDTSTHTFTAVLCILILLRSNDPGHDAACISRAAQMAGSIRVDHAADFFYSSRTRSGLLESETTREMTPVEFLRAYHELAADTGPLVAFAASKLERTAAEDVVQNVMEQLLRLPPEKIARIKNLRAYAKGCVSNAVADVYRARARGKPADASDPGVEIEMSQSAARVGEGPKETSEAAELEEEWKLLIDAFLILKPLEREVVMAHTFHGEPAQRVAARMSLTTHQVYGISERVRSKLTQWVSQRGKEDQGDH